MKAKYRIKKTLSKQSMSPNKDNLYINKLVKNNNLDENWRFFLVVNVDYYSVVIIKIIHNITKAVTELHVLQSLTSQWLNILKLNMIKVECHSKGGTLDIVFMKRSYQKKGHNLIKVHIKIIQPIRYTQIWL